MDLNKKPIKVSPFSSRLFDGTQPLIYVAPAIFLGILGFPFFLSLGLLLTWWNIPGLPVPDNPMPPIYHLKAFWLMWLGYFLPFARGQTFTTYLSQIHWWNANGQEVYLTVRWIFAFICGVCGAFFLYSKGLVVTTNAKQVRGRILVEGTDAFKDLKQVFDQVIKDAAKWLKPEHKANAHGLILASNVGYNPNDRNTYEGRGVQVLRYPDAQRRTHTVILGGSRRGKGVVNKQHVVQIYNHIRRGERYKLMIVDTLKGEYAALFKKKYMIQIAPDEKFSVVYDFAADLLLREDMAKFVGGFIKVSDKDPIWGESGRGIATAIGTFLISEAGTDWGLNNFAYFKDQPIEVLTDIVGKYYPEMNQIVNMGESPLSSILGTMASSLLFMNGLSRIWDGYDYKVPIHQMSAALLKRDFWLDWYLKKAFPEKMVIMSRKEIDKFTAEKLKVKRVEISSIEMKLSVKQFTEIKGLDPQYVPMSEDDRQLHIERIIMLQREVHEIESQFIEEEKEVDVPFNLCTSALIYAFVKEMAAAKPDWKWVHLKKLLQDPWDTQLKIAKKHLKDDYRLQYVERAYLNQHLDNIMPILKLAEVWDSFEAKPKFSLRNWLLDENPKKKILLLKPSGRFNFMEGVTRGILLYMNGIVNDKYFREDKSDAVPLRSMYLFCDEFQSLGNLKEFISPALEMWASKGISVTLSCQDYSQIRDTYGDNWLRFLQANTGNLMIVGANQGESAEMISNQLGKMKIVKLHTSQTDQENGKSTSRNYQEHDGELVMTPDEVNSKLGAKGDTVHYLYVPGNVDKAYILTAPITRYATHYQPEEPDWMKGIKHQPAAITKEEAFKAVFASGGKHKPATDRDHETHLDESDVVQDAASEMDEDDFTPEEYEAMQEAALRSERAPLHNLPPESEGMQSTIMKDAAAGIVGGPIFTAISHAEEILTDAKRNVTRSKAKYHREWKLKKERDIEQFTKD